MLRGCFQETLLPNVAFIGGGAEVAYWMQLKTLFDAFGIFYPCVLLRQSVLWVNPEVSKRLAKTGLKVSDLFVPEEQFLHDFIKQSAATDWQTTHERKELNSLISSLKAKAMAVDTTLEKSVAAALSKMDAQLEKIEKKMYRAEKKKAEVYLNRIAAVRSALFPGGSLQERTENFMPYDLESGPQFIDTVRNGIRPLDNKFLIISQ